MKSFLFILCLIILAHLSLAKSKLLRKTNSNSSNQSETISQPIIEPIRASDPPVVGKAHTYD